MLTTDGLGRVTEVHDQKTRAEFNKLKKEQFAADSFINRQGATAVGKNAERAGVERIDSVMKILWEP